MAGFLVAGKINDGVKYGGFAENRHIIPATFLQDQTQFFAISTFYYLKKIK